MPLVKSTGNMYSWVSHMHTHLDGECPHQCSYCYVGKSRFGRPERYKGEIRLREKELSVNYGSGKTIFIEHMTDLFADDTPGLYREMILEHCKSYPDNTYIFQTKNPKRYEASFYFNEFPPNFILGTTIETNRDDTYQTKAPCPIDRLQYFAKIKEVHNVKTFITIEPIMKFDIRVMEWWLGYIRPDFVNIGADSKHCNLPEPTKQEVEDLIKAIQDNGIEIKVKSNLERLLK